MIKLTGNEYFEIYKNKLCDRILDLTSGDISERGIGLGKALRIMVYEVFGIKKGDGREIPEITVANMTKLIANIDIVFSDSQTTKELLEMDI